MDMPSTRYRVVTRGRRLEVIDTMPGAARPASVPTLAGSPPQTAGAPASSPMPERVRFDGTREWITSPAYDARGPRRVRLGPGEGGAFALRSAALLLAIATATKGPRRPLSQWVAGLLDSYAVDG